MFNGRCYSFSQLSFSSLTVVAIATIVFGWQLSINDQTLSVASPSVSPVIPGLGVLWRIRRNASNQERERIRQITINSFLIHGWLSDGAISHTSAVILSRGSNVKDNDKHA